MAKFQIDASALAIAVVAAAFGFSLLPGPFSWLASIIGLVLAIVLFSFDREGSRSLFESLGFSAVVGLCLTLASAVVFRAWLANQSQPTTFEGHLTNEYLPLFWLAVTVLIWVIDRSRMSGRVAYPAPAALPPATYQAAPSLVPHGATPAPAKPIAPPSPEPVTSVPAASPRAGAFTQPSFAPSFVETPLPAAVAPVMPPPEPAASIAAHPAPVQPAPIAPAPVYTEASRAVPPTPPPPQAVPIPAGKEASIYVTLIGEGLNVLRAVRAEHLGRDFYRIVEEMPAGETWQFGPGQVVRCKKKNLSSGKAMVAIEEAPRAAQ